MGFTFAATPIASGDNPTVQDVFDDVRRILNDQDDNPYRWPDSILLVYVNTGIRMIIGLRPDFLLSDVGVVAEFSEITLATEEVPFTEDQRMVLIDYVCYRAFFEDSDDPNNSRRAQAHKKAYEEGIFRDDAR